MMDIDEDATTRALLNRLNGPIYPQGNDDAAIVQSLHAAIHALPPATHDALLPSLTAPITLPHIPIVVPPTSMQRVDSKRNHLTSIGISSGGGLRPTEPECCLCNSATFTTDDGWCGGRGRRPGDML